MIVKCRNGLRYEVGNLYLIFLKQNPLSFSKMVLLGTKKKVTAGGLDKTRLKKNRKGRIVGTVASMAAKRNKVGC